MAKWFLILIYTSFMALKSYAVQPKAALLFAVSGKGLDQVMYFEIKKKMRSLFNDFSRKNHFSPHLFMQAKAKDFWHVLTSGDYQAVYIVAHGDYLKNNKLSFLQSFKSIVDYDLFDVTDFFQKIHPNIKLISIASCNSKKIIQELFHRPQFKTKKRDLNILGFNRKINIQGSVKRSLLASEKMLKEIISMPPKSYPKCQRRGIKISYTRILSSKENGAIFPSLQILSQDGEILGFIEGGKEGNIRKGSFYLPVGHKLTRTALQFKITTGKSYLKKENSPRK